MRSHFFGCLRSLVDTRSTGFPVFFSFAVVAGACCHGYWLDAFPECLSLSHLCSMVWTYVLWSWSHCAGSSMTSWWYHSDFPEGFSQQSSPFLSSSLHVGAWCPQSVTVFTSALTFSSFSGWSLEGARLSALGLLYLAPGCAQSLHTFRPQPSHELHPYFTAFVQGLQPAGNLSLSLPPRLATAVANGWSRLFQQMLPE